MSAPITGVHRGRVTLTDPERLWLVAYASRVGYAELADRLEVDGTGLCEAAVASRTSASAAARCSIAERPNEVYS